MKTNFFLKLTSFIFLILIVIFPSITFAQTANTCVTLTGIGNLLCRAHQILNSVIPVLVVLGVVYLIWGVVQYVIADGDEAKKKGRDRTIFGIIGLVVIVGLWGIVNIVVNTFGLGGQNAPNVTNLVVVETIGPFCSDLSNTSKISDVLNYFTCIIGKSIIPLIFALAVAMFVWGVVQFVINSSEEAKKEKGRQFMIWGIIALTVMVSVWGLVAILGNTFGIDTNFIPQVKE